GSSQPPFETWILLFNPGSDQANVALTFMKDSGDNQDYRVTAEPGMRRSILVNEVLPQSAFATRITSDKPIVAERSVYMKNGGGHGTVGAREANKTWDLAEGSTMDTSDTWILLQNPGRNPAKVTLTYLRENGS